MKISIGEMKKLLNDVEGVHTDLTGSLKNVAHCLESINNNVKSDQLVAGNKGFYESLMSNSNTIAETIPTVKEFLNAQITEYEQANQTAKETVDSLVQKINETFNKPNI